MMPPFGPGPPLPAPLPHDPCGSSVLAWPGGAPPLLGHGGWPFDVLVDAGVGCGVGAFVGFGDGLAVGAAVGAAVGFVVGLAVGGAAVGPPVAVGWLGLAVVPDVGLPGAGGEALATALVGAGLPGAPLPVGDGDGDGIGPLGDALGPGLADGWGLPGDALAPLVGVGVGTIAIALGPLLAPARCCSSTPPRPSAIVARTRFRTPRLRMSRAR
jgi:hypothetical protein